jgi:hypothetical protein
MMPHLGVLAEVHPQAAVEVFERDCLIYLGTCIAPKGAGKPGRPCFRYAIKGATLNESGELRCGELKRLPLGDGETARITVELAEEHVRGGTRIRRQATPPGWRAPRRARPARC